MNITAASRAALAVAGAALVLTIGVAAAKTDRETATRHCMALAHMASPPGARPTLGIRRNQTVAFNQCMERAGFGHHHAEEK